MKKYLFTIGMSALAFTACDNSPKFVVEGTISNAADSTLYLEADGLSGIETIDSVKLGSNGNFSFKGAPSDNPEFYHIRLGNNIISFCVDSTETIKIKADAKQLPLVEAFASDKKVFVAGSSWQPDEDIFIPYFNAHQDWKMIIAPHVIGEDHLQQILGKLEGRKVIRYTELANSQQTTANSQEADVLIIDCFGLLSSIYHYATVTYVGGGFGEGIHNTLEAAVWGVPVIFGPNNQRFQEAQGLKDCGGGYEIKDAADFNRVMQRFLDEPQSLEKASKEAGDFVSQRVGATDRILSCVQLY